MMTKNRKKPEKLFSNKKGVHTVQHQLLESYQSGVVEDQLKNNKDIFTYNNQSK